MTPPDSQINHDIRDFRQPMVTSPGIILGFLLSFLGQWAIENENGTAISSRAGHYYQRTFQLYMAAVCIAFTGVAAALFI